MKRWTIYALLTLLVACATFAPSSPATAPATASSSHRVGSFPVLTWAGDLAGSTNLSQTVAALQGHTLPAPSGTNTLLTWSGTALSWSNLGLSALTPGTAGQFLVTNSGATAPAWATCSQDIACSTSTVGQMALQSITPTGGTSTIVPFNAGGLKLATSPWVLQDSGAVQRFQLETTHGKGYFGGGGTDFKTICGPIVGSETSQAGCYGLAAATAASSSNWAWYSDGSNMFLQAPNGGASLNATNGNLLLQASSGNAVYLRDTGGTYGVVMTPAAATTLQATTSTTSLGVGTNKAGALTKLYGDANVQDMALGNAAITTTAYNEFDAVSAPGAGATTTERIYTDSADSKLKVVDGNGNIFTLTP